MAQTSMLPQELMTNSLLHFQQGVPIDDLHLTPQQRSRLKRVSHVYWVWKGNPMIDAFQLLKHLIRSQAENGGKRYADPQSEWRAAQKDKWLFDFIVEQVSPPSRRVQEAKVRYAADKLMEMGLATDNGRDIAEGAKLAIKLDRLDQPESQQADFSKAAFLPAVVTISAKEIDPTKEDQTDEQARLIMAKYGAYVDEKRKAVDDRVEVMMARKEGAAEEELSEYSEHSE